MNIEGVMAMLKPVRTIFYVFIGFCVIFKGTVFAFGFNRLETEKTAQAAVAVLETPQPVEINEALLNAITRVESSNNPRAFHKKTRARGLSQIRHSAWKDLVKFYPSKYKNLNYKKDIFHPGIAREAGRDYLNLLKYYLAKKELPVDLENLLAAYNWGIGKLGKFGLENAPRETKNYIQKIRLHLRQS